MRWPIPNIPEIFARLGAKRPKFFAKIDLTSGYHQLPIDEASQILTAFITPFGLYKWCRLPMGPKGGGSYFMQMIQRVLTGLLYTICEVYLDDVLVYGDTEEEFLANLDKVFARFLPNTALHYTLTNAHWALTRLNMSDISLMLRGSTSQLSDLRQYSTL